MPRKILANVIPQARFWEPPAGQPLLSRSIDMCQRPAVQCYMRNIPSARLALQLQRLSGVPG